MVSAAAAAAGVAAVGIAAVGVAAVGVAAVGLGRGDGCDVAGVFAAAVVAGVQREVAEGVVRCRWKIMDFGGPAEKNH